MIVAANIPHWHTDRFTLGDIAYYACMYLVLAMLAVRVFGHLRAGIEGVAVLAAFFSIGPLGALLVIGSGHIGYELLARHWEVRTQRRNRNLLAFSTLAVLNVILLSFGLLLAAWVYFALDGELPLLAFRSTQFVESSAALIVYTSVTIFSKIALAYATTSRIERPHFDLRRLRFMAFQALAHVLALLVAILYNSGDLVSNLTSVGVLIIAALIARSTERDYFALIRRVDALATLNTIGQTLSHDLTVDDLVSNLYTQVRRVMDASIFYVALYDPRTEQVSFPLAMKCGVQQHWQPTPLRGTVGHIIKTGKAFLLCGSLEKSSAQLRKLGIEVSDQPSCCYLGAPMIAENTVLGVIAVQSLNDPYAYDRDDLAVLEIIAAQAASALQNIRLYEDLLGVVKKLSLLNEASAQTIANFELEPLLENACRALQAVGNAQSAAIFLLEPDSHTFTLQRTLDLPEAAEARHIPAECEACLRSVLCQSSPTVIKDVTELPSESAWRSYAGWAGCQSLLALPLHVEAQPIGVAIAHYDAPFAFDQSAPSLLTAFANQLATSLANAYHHADIEQRAQELAQLVEASRALTTSLELPRIAERLFDDLQRLFAPTLLAVLRLLPDGALEPIASRAEGDFPVAGRLMAVGGFAEALQSQQTCLLPRTAEDTALLERLSCAQALVIPMVNDAQAFGAVVVFHNKQTSITGRARQLAEALVNQAALAFLNAQAYQQVDSALEARIDELSAIESISRKISGALNLDVIISEVLRAALERTDADLVSVLLLPTHKQNVRLERFMVREDVQIVLPNHALDGIVGQVLRTGSPVRLEDTRLAPNYVQPTNLSMRSELCVPIVYEGQRVGVLNLESRRLAAFNAAHERFLTNLAEHAAIALGTTQLFQQLEYQISTLQRLRTLSFDVLTAGSLSVTLNLLVDAVIKTIHNGSVHLLLCDSHPVDSDSPHVKQLRVPYPDPNAYQVIRLPIQRGGQYFGEFIISLDDPADLGDNRVYALELIAMQAAIALENMRLFEEVRARRDQMQTVFDSAQEGMLLISHEGVLMLANRAAEQLLNYPLIALQGRSVRHLELPFADALGAELPRKPTRRHYRLTLDDIVRDVEETTIPVLDASNQPVSRLIVLRDITQEEALKEFQQEVSSMVVHDLRAPTTNMISSLRLLQELISAKDYTELENVIGVALNSAYDQLRLIDSLLDIARLETRRMPMNVTGFSLFNLACEVLQTFETVAQDAQVRLVNQITPRLPHAYADQEQIRRVLFNLLDNALRHTPSGGQIRLSAHLNVTERTLCVSVTDTGKGVPPEQRTRIFEKFVQISKSAVRGHRGSGLGLTFCRLSIEAHGGKIWVESGAEGGAAFFFTLPLAPQQNISGGE
ncbi:MAG: GAF domain-containing protein [Aggregatilineales bacterium]